jgi:glycerol-3-phosphate dehydrogenase
MANDVGSVSDREAESAYDLAVIGGGVNGCGIARDAAGRGWSVFLCEANDLASATSSASTKLVHGGLRYLEYREFRLVREALKEREVLWAIAPHIVWPLRFVLPHHSGLRPAWLLRLGLFLYDHLGGRRLLPPTRQIRLDDDPAGRLLKPEYTRAFEYSDCWVDDSRLVVLNARDAADKGATVATRTSCVSGSRVDGGWSLMLRDERTGERREIRARALVNAAGPWVGAVLQSVLRANSPARVRMVQGSHIVVPRLYPEEHCYIFQNADGRIFFVIPYERDFTLIGTTDRDFQGDPADVRASPEEIAYLCEAASAYFIQPIRPEQVVWTYSGVRPLYDDGASAAQAATRDYVLELDAPPGEPPLLSVFGGKITTYRRLAEAALAKLEPSLPHAVGRAAGWTGREALPGGGFGPLDFPKQLEAARARYPDRAEATLYRLLRAYGTELDLVLAGEGADKVVGADLTEAEVRYLAAREWAQTADDIAWRRSKLGLRLSPAELALVQALLARLQPVPEAVS